MITNNYTNNDNNHYVMSIVYSVTFWMNRLSEKNNGDDKQLRYSKESTHQSCPVESTLSLTWLDSRVYEAKHSSYVSLTWFDGQVYEAKRSSPVSLTWLDGRLFEAEHLVLSPWLDLMADCIKLNM